jgi:beta-N-acetylhexosaminidase
MNLLVYAAHLASQPATRRRCLASLLWKASRGRCFRLLGAWLLVMVLLPARPGLAQTPVPSTEAAAVQEENQLVELAQQVVDRMSPEQRIGQLFVVMLPGREVTINSDFVDLIYTRAIGGVLLSPLAGNFSNARGVNTPRQVAVLTNQLQALAYGVLLPEEHAMDPVPIAPWPPRDRVLYLPDGTAKAPGNLPLLIGVLQSGDDLPATSLRRGFTPLPSPLAMGASWNRDLVEQTGEIVGRELRAVGFNLLLGPNLDVFRSGNVEKVNTLGLYTFGSNPHWVSQLGRAFIEGVHDGSNGRVATVAGSFPGQGNTDRVPDAEIATIQSSQAELRQNALPPFLAVTRQISSLLDPAGDPGAADLLMTSHMRYTGLQGGDSRGRPLSLAPELRTILRQEGLADWQSQGGLIMSGPLAAPALRRYFEEAGAEEYRRVAQDAFVAGNDLLLLADPSSDSVSPTYVQTLRATLDAFLTLYAEDRDFADRVDAAARRIVRLKLGLYRTAVDPAALSAPALQSELPAAVIPLPSVLVTESDVGVLASEERVEAEQQMGELARSAITLLYPDPATQTVPVPPAFNQTDQILIFTDFRLQRECLTCEQEPSIGPDTLALLIERLYGSQSTGVIDPAKIVSRTFVELTALLDSLEAAAPAAPADPSAMSLFLPTPTPTRLPSEGSPPPPSDLESGAGAASTDVASRTLAALRNADWIVFVMLDVAGDYTSLAVKRLLGDHATLLTDQKTVVLAAQAPYYLDATEMSRLTAYLGVYSKTPPFLESAVHALFRRYLPVGAPPVDVPGTRFSTLSERLLPDPALPLGLTIEESDGTALARSNALPPLDERPTVEPGKILRLRAGPIRDLNGNPVPDGTQVSFELRYEGEEAGLVIGPVATRSGSAVYEVTLERSGVLRASARSHAASSGDGISLVVLPPALPAPALLSPALPSAALPSAALLSPSLLSPTAAVTLALQTPPADPAELTLARSPAPDRANVLTLVIALMTLLITLSLLLIVQIRVLSRPALVKHLLWATIFGLAGYILYAVGLVPGGTWLRSYLGLLGVPIVVFIPMLIPLLWLQLRSEER